MEELVFEKYIDTNIRNQKEPSAIISFTLKQISRARFEIADNICKVKILLNGDKETVILTNSIHIYDFRNLVYTCSTSEPSLMFLDKQIKNLNQPLIEFLENYQKKFYKLGSEFENEYCYKLYSKTEIESDLRILYQAGWIDYEAQLENGNIIHDELGLCGLWSMPTDMLLEVFNNECKKNYGDRLFILKLIPQCRYIHDGKEIIGDRYEVCESYDLNSIEDIGKIFKHRMGLVEDEYQAKISQLCKENTCLKTEYDKLSDRQFNIEIMCKKLYYTSKSRWLLLVVGILIGFILKVFI